MPTVKGGMCLILYTVVVDFRPARVCLSQRHTSTSGKRQLWALCRAPFSTLTMCRRQWKRPQTQHGGKGPPSRDGGAIAWRRGQRRLRHSRGNMMRQMVRAPLISRPSTPVSGRFRAATSFGCREATSKEVFRVSPNISPLRQRGRRHVLSAGTGCVPSALVPPPQAIPKTVWAAFRCVATTRPSPDKRSHTPVQRPLPPCLCSFVSVLWRGRD